MKIIQYMPRIDLEHGGPVRAVLDLCALFASREHDVTLVTYFDDDVPMTWRGREPGTPTVRVIAPPTLPGSLFGAAACREIRGIIEGADILHLHETWTPSNIQFGRVARRAGVPYVISPRGMLDDWCMAQKGLKKRVFHAVAGKKLFERAAYVHCTADAELGQSQKWFPKGRGRVIPNLLDLDPYRSPPGPEQARERFEALAAPEPSLLFLSRVHMKKGIEHLIRAAGALAREGQACNVLIAGSGEESYVEELKVLASDEGVSDRISFLGLVTGDLKVSLYQAADVFVLPTNQENFGFVLVEAMAAGTPVLTTKGVDIWPELEASGGALIVPRADEGLAQAIGELIQERDKLGQMGASGKAWVFDNLDSNTTAERFETMYQDAIKGA